MERSPLSPNLTVQASAARWLVRMQADDCTAQERAAFQRWQAEDPAHAAATGALERIQRATAGLDADPTRNEALRAIRARGDRRAVTRRRVRYWSAGLGVAAAALLVVGVVWHEWDPAGPMQRYATAVGERHAVSLEDGSELLLDTDSVVTVRYSRKRRNLELERGRAQFTVAAAPQRPFVVRAGAGEVRALGTRFQVRRLSGAVQVALLEGKVSVTAPVAATGARTVTLQAGEGLRFDGADLWVGGPVDSEAAAGWPRGELVFHQRPLAELVEEMNRYTPVKLRLGDPALGELRLSGVFYDGNQTSLLNALNQVWNVRAERTSPQEIVLYAH